MTLQRSLAPDRRARKRRRGSVRRISLMPVLAGFFLSLPVAALAAEPEFGGSCAMGLVSHQRIRTDCSIDWISRDGKRYCFSSAESKTEFLKSPDENIQRAAEMYAAAGLGDIARDLNRFASGDAQAYVDELIKAESARNGGVYAVDDPVTASSIPLIYENVDFTRTIDGYGFFPDVIFHAKDDPRKKYLIDFWVAPQNGKLAVLQTRIYKTPVQKGDAWAMTPRQPKPWWWIPASEHPGQSEQKRSWEIMSSIEAFVQASGQKGEFALKDDKTGEEIALKFIGVHQPIRRLKDDGQFFACTDFRKTGTTDQFYDIDFWLDMKNGQMIVTKVRVHKEPRLVDDSYVQVPRYNFDSKTFDIVP
jgi:YHS domain-containing protein